MGSAVVRWLIPTAGAYFQKGNQASTCAVPLILLRAAYTKAGTATRSAMPRNLRRPSDRSMSKRAAPPRIRVATPVTVRLRWQREKKKILENVESTENPFLCLALVQRLMIDESPVFFYN